MNKQCKNVLNRELQQFTVKGLNSLAKDLADRRVDTNDWISCPLSYRKGFPGSVLVDSNGMEANYFTDAWDNFEFTHEEVLKFVNDERCERNLI